MAIYEYQCPEGHVTTHMSTFADKPTTVKCEHCDKAAEFVVSATPTTFHANDRKAIKGATISRRGTRT